MKYWSRGLSQATYMARDGRSRRPARPACCHSDATVPGKPRCRVASRRPMSMPSSSALVAATPRSAPDPSAPSTSRRSAGE